MRISCTLKICGWIEAEFRCGHAYPNIAQIRPQNRLGKAGSLSGWMQWYTLWEALSCVTEEALRQADDGSIIGGCCFWMGLGGWGYQGFVVVARIVTVITALLNFKWSKDSLFASSTQPFHSLDYHSLDYPPIPLCLLIMRPVNWL